MPTGHYAHRAPDDTRGIAAAAKDRYRRLGATGFLKPVHEYAVWMGDQCVLIGVNKRDNDRAFKRWCGFSETIGRAKGQTITLTKNGEVVNRYTPENTQK